MPQPVQPPWPRAPDGNQWTTQCQTTDPKADAKPLGTPVACTTQLRHHHRRTLFRASRAAERAAAAAAAAAEVAAPADLDLRRAVAFFRASACTCGEAVEASMPQRSLMKRPSHCSSGGDSCT